MKRLILAAMLASGIAAAPAYADDALKAAIASKDRTPANAARDGARHPYETLQFFGIKPNMTVVELSPGGGWYTEILAPYLRDSGKLIMAADSPTSENENSRKSAERMTKKLEANPGMYGKVVRGQFEVPRAYNYAAPGTADMVVTFRNLHNWAGAPGAMDAVLKSVHTALKSGGVFGVVEHRANTTKPYDPKSGYMVEADVIKTIEKAGFKLAAKSEINANPKDTADYAKGVWTLPPVLANKDVDREKYMAIGESDRMTLKFIKQ
ncbi:MAG: methyltransferase [Pseudomonadota bacterium]